VRVVISEFISLDGVVQAPGGADEDTSGGFRHGGWSMPYFDPEVMGPALMEAVQQTDATLQGRRTYQISAAAWPERTDDDDPFSTLLNKMHKYVVSDTLTEDDLTWGPATLIRNADLLDKVAELRDQPGDGDLSVSGSTEVARALLAADLVDELSLVVEPIVLGGGKTIFVDDGEARPFELVSTLTANTGVLVNRYRRAR
jgi:dihydrofolate reductase